MAMNLSPAGAALFNYGRSGVASDSGLGGMLQRQVGDETEEEKLRRKLGLSALQSGSTLAGGSPAARALFGGLGGTNIRY